MLLYHYHHFTAPQTKRCCSQRANALWFTIDPIRGCFCLHCCRLTAEGDKACRLVVEYTLVYVTSVNALLKRAIERGGWGPRQRSAA